MKTPDEQLQFFRYRLGKTQLRPALRAFEDDLTRSNLDVMWAALLAAESYVQRTKRVASDVREAVLTNYARAAAAIGQLFPVFFVFESAWRTYVAMRLDAIYGDGRWWHDVRDLVAQGAECSSVIRLGTLPAKGEVVRELARIISRAPLPSNLETTYSLLELADLKSLEVLIDRHWTEMASTLVATPTLGMPTAAQFTTLFARVRKARNDAYHHRVVANRPDVIAAAEQLVDLLNIHLGDRVGSMARADLPALAFKVVREPRHG